MIEHTGELAELIAARDEAERRFDLIDPTDVFALDAAALELTAAELRVRSYLADQREAVG